MNRKKGRIPKGIKIGGIIVAAFLVAIIVEIIFFQAKHADERIEMQLYPLAEKNEFVTTVQEEILEPLSEDEKNGILMSRENAKILSELNGTTYEEEQDDTLVENTEGMYRKKISTVFTIQLAQESYIRKVHLQYKGLEDKSNYTLSLYRGDKAVYEGIDGIMDARLDAAVVTLNKTGDKLVYRFNSVKEPDIQAMQLSIVNLTSMNWLRVLFVAISILFCLAFLLCHSIFVEKVEWVFAATAMILGTILILCIGTNQIGFDEYVHATRAYERSFGTTIETTETAMRMRGNDLPVFHNREERGLVEAYEDSNNDFSWADISTQSRFVTYTDRSYLPISMFIKIGRMLGMPFAWNMMLGKFGNLLFFTILGFWAIKLAKGGKALIALLALIPNSLFAAAGFTYDSVVNGGLLLAVVMTTNLLQEKKEKITWIQVLLVLGAYIAGSTAKPIYIVMALMLVFLSQKRFENRLQAWGFRAAIVAIVGLLLYTIFFPPVSTSANYELVGNLAYAGDKRNQGTSVLGQLNYIFANPIAFSKLLLGSMFGSLFAYVAGQRQFFNYGYLGGLPGIFTILLVIIFIAAAIWRPEDEAEDGLPIKYRILNGVMIFGVSAIIWTSMYVSYTPVGNAVIEGVQARYFMPLFLPTVYCLYGGKKLKFIKRESYHKILLGFAVFLNLLAIYLLALKPLNL